MIKILGGTIVTGLLLESHQNPATVLVVNSSDIIQADLKR